jgi:integral membrane protein
MCAVSTPAPPSAPDAPAAADPAARKKLLNQALVVGLADAALLVILVFFAFVHRSDTAVHILGPIHGLGFLALLALTANGAMQAFWTWWFPAAVLITGGPIGSLAGDYVLRRRED